MMKLYMSDIYRIDVTYPLDSVEIDILYFLYQPLIGTQALSTYMMLYTEGKRMKKFLKPSSISRLVSYLSYSLIDVQKYIETLEGIGLLKTFIKHEQDLTYYIFQIQNPLSLSQYFKNQILSSLLQEALSPEDFNYTLKYFESKQEDLTGYEDITSSFNDVFDIRLHKQNVLAYKEPLLNKSTNDINTLYDDGLFIQSLKDYQVALSTISSDDQLYIKQLASVYSIDGITLAGFVKDAMNSKGFQKDIFKQKIQGYNEVNAATSLKEVYHKQPVQYQTLQNQNDPLTLHMKYLDSITPYELLKIKQGGKEPVFHDLRIVETLMVQLSLQPAVVNVILEYVLGKNNGRLSKSYCEAIGASLSRKHINSAIDAYNALMDENQGQKEEVVQEDETNKPAVDMDEFEQLLQELKEGKL